MKNLRHLSVLAVVFIAFSSRTSAAATIEGEVVRIADGDTITVLDSSKIQHNIRLAGIDAPERSQPFSNRSKQNLSSLVFGKAVVVEFSKTDRYGRLVGKVIVNGRDGCFEQLKAGLAGCFDNTNTNSRLKIESRTTKQSPPLVPLGSNCGAIRGRGVLGRFDILIPPRLRPTSQRRRALNW